ncbi:MAG TPA: pectin esterase [Pricia antarctica]|uniref:Pectinesterase n=2 Tax=root TaxID=1 RepID=A0A831QU12_9FLAO|nr:pectin esterase [Pricia antarctica]
MAAVAKITTDNDTPLKNKQQFWREIGQEIDIYNLTVAQDGSGDFKTIQAAINAAKGFPDKPVIIKIKNGVYKEKVTVYEWNTNMSLIGENRENTIITYNDFFDKIDLGRNSTFHTSTLKIEGNDFFATNLTIENTAGDVGQAVALSINANRAMLSNCSIKGFQDTVYVTGEDFKQYFKDCYIEGSTDFIFGQATVLFENCQIHSKSNSFITAASTPKGVDYGYVFENCKLTADPNVNQVYLGRPWRTYAKTVFISCYLENHIVPEGWQNWENKDAEKNSFYAEFNNSGPGFRPKQRVSWSKILTEKQVKSYTKKEILGKIPWYEKFNKF